MGRCMAKDENHWYITSHHSVFVTNRRIQIQCFVNTEQYIRICFKGELSSFSLRNHTSAYADAAALKEFCENAKPGKFGDNTRCLIVQRSSPTKYLARAAWDQVILRAATVVAHKNGFVNLSSKLYQVLQRDVSTLVSCDKHQACLWLQWCACWQAECLKNALVDELYSYGYSWNTRVLLSTEMTHTTCAKRTRRDKPTANSGKHAI